jgi:hypothetical protein
MNRSPGGRLLPVARPKPRPAGGAIAFVFRRGTDAPPPGHRWRARAAGSRFRLYPLGALEARRLAGRRSQDHGIDRGHLHDGGEQGAGLARGSIDCAAAMLYNGPGRDEGTLAAARFTARRPTASAALACALS